MRRHRRRHKPREYLFEDRLYREMHARGERYYQHKPDDLCAEDLACLWSWPGFPHVGQRLLELGCGDGFHTALLAGMGLDVTGIDCSPAAIAQAGKNLRAAGRQATVLVMDACDLSLLGQASFRYVLDSHCLHCITDYDQRLALLTQVRYVLQDGGSFFVATMGAQSMGWTQQRGAGRWLEQYAQDERGCWVMSCLPPRSDRRVNLRIWVTEEMLRAECAAAHLEIVRFEPYRSPVDPADLIFLAELR